jgi:hypothetical protein
MVRSKLTDSISLCLRGSSRGIDLGCGDRRLDRDVRSRCRVGFLCGIGLARDVPERRYAGLLFDIELEDNLFLKRRSNRTQHFEDRIEIPQCLPLFYRAHEMRHLVARI